jgi:hypothetical protein
MHDGGKIMTGVWTVEIELLQIVYDTFNDLHVDEIAHETVRFNSLPLPSRYTSYDQQLIHKLNSE